MARPLRVDVAGAWYHVMNRGHRGEALYRDDADRGRFLGAVAELPERFRLEVHVFVLMDNHYHLLVRTGQPNLSHAIRWLNVTYAVKFNWAHRSHGTVFQGRFKSVLIQEESKAVEVARYLHLNPVRIGGLGLSKEDQRRARVLGCENPGEELVKRRLEVLREYRWSHEEQTPVRRLHERVKWIELVRAAEKIKGEPWERWAERYGDWSRDATMYVATRYGGLRLAEVVQEMGIRYQAAAQAVKRFGQALADDPKRKRFVAALRRQMSTM